MNFSASTQADVSNRAPAHLRRSATRRARRPGQDDPIYPRHRTEYWRWAGRSGIGLVPSGCARKTTKSSSRSGHRHSRPPSRNISNPLSERRRDASPPHSTRRLRLPDQPASISIAHVAGVACMTVAPVSSSLRRRAKAVGQLRRRRNLDLPPAAAEGKLQSGNIEAYRRLPPAACRPARIPAPSPSRTGRSSNCGV